MKILTFAGSLQKNSLNKKVCKAVESFYLAQKTVEIEYVDLKTLDIPVYDGDIETASGLPQGVQKLCALIASCNALVVSSPEYNGSISGVMKNTLDWVSRSKPQPLAGKNVLLCAASPGGLGGVRGLWHTRVPFEVLGCHVYPEMLGIAKAHEVLTSEAAILDEKVRANFERILKEFAVFIQ